MRWIAALLLLLLGGIAWWGLSARDGDGLDARHEAVVSPEPPAPRGATPRADPEPTEPAGERVSVAPAPARSDEATPSPATRVLRGLVTDGEGGPPLPGLPLEVLRARGERDVLARVVTDAEGRFETRPLPCVELSPRHTPELEDAERAVQLWIQPGAISLTPSADGAPLERTFWVTRPREVVLVDVVHEDGSPAAGARVVLPFVARDPESGVQLSTAGGAETDSSGRARIGLWDSAGFEHGSLFARGVDDDVSEVLELDPTSYPGPHRLRLGPPSALVLRVHWARDGEPVAGCDVRANGPRDFPRPGEPERFRGVTDRAGALELSGLYPAEYTVWVANPRTQGSDSSPVRLWRGETTALEIELEQGSRELAVRGLVVDEDGAPLAGVELEYRPDGGWSEQVETDGAGRFECWAVPCDVLELVLDADPHGDEYEPASRTVAFGARDVRFRRTARAESRRFELRARDRATGADLEDVFVTFDRGAARDEWSNTFAPRELYVVDATPTTHCRVGVQGYVRASFVLFEALEAAEGDPPRIEVALDRGLSLTVQVLDLDTRAPLAGATFSAPDVPVVRTGPDGIARIEADRWSIYALERAGYEPEEWDPADTVLFDFGPLYMSAVE